jgi:hypothetical protein
MTHGAAAPQVREAARRRLALLLDPALRCLYDLMMQRDNLSVALQAVKEVLERNQLYALESCLTAEETSGGHKGVRRIDFGCAFDTDLLEDRRQLLAETTKCVLRLPNVHDAEALVSLPRRVS